MVRIQVTELSVEELRDIIASAVADTMESTSKKKAQSSILTKKEFANLIGKSTSWVDNERRQDRIKWKMIGGTVAIPFTETQKYL